MPSNSLIYSSQQGEAEIFALGSKNTVLLVIDSSPNAELMYQKKSFPIKVDYALNVLTLINIEA